MIDYSSLEKAAQNGFALYDTKDQLRDYVYNLSEKAFSAGDKKRDAIADTDALQEHQRLVRKSFLKAIGPLPEFETPVTARTVGKEAFDGYTAEKIIYRPRPGVYVTSTLYIPENLKAPSAAVLFLCGHHMEGKHGQEYQSVCQTLVRAGLIVLAIDPLGQGERLAYYNPSLGICSISGTTQEHEHIGFQCWAVGNDLTKYFVHDAMGGIDYLCSHPEVDASRIGVTGNSGGGTQTVMMMMADSRIAAAVPATFIMSRKGYMYTGQAQDREQIWTGMTEEGLDHADFVSVMAPKPVLILGVEHDFFPSEATKETFEKCRKIWKLCGAGEKLEMFFDDSFHYYTQKMAKKAAEFFALHLLGEKNVSIDEGKISAVDGKRLWCTETGQLRGEVKDARFVFDENQDAALAVLNNRGTKENRREKTVEFVKTAVFKNRTAADLTIKKTEAPWTVQNTICQGYCWYTQQRFLNYGLLLWSMDCRQEKLPLTIALWKGGTACLDAHFSFLRDTCESGRAVLVLDVSGIGRIEQRSICSWSGVTGIYGAVPKLNDDLLWLGDSIAALRVYDILRALDAARELTLIDDADIRVYTEGRYSVYADLAALIDNRIKGVDTENPLVSYAGFAAEKYYYPDDIASVIFPGLFAYADLDEIRRWNMESHKKF